MQTHAQAFRRILEDKIKEEIDREKDVLAGGKVADFNEYKLKAGRIAGLELAMNLCDDAETALESR